MKVVQRAGSVSPVLPELALPLSVPWPGKIPILVPSRCQRAQRLRVNPGTGKGWEITDVLNETEPLVYVSNVLLEQTGSQIKILKVTIRIYLHNYCQRNSWNVLSSARGASWLSLCLPVSPGCFAPGGSVKAVPSPGRQEGFCSQMNLSILFIYLVYWLRWNTWLRQSQIILLVWRGWGSIPEVAPGREPGSTGVPGLCSPS